jgi:hypothetical protein
VPAGYLPDSGALFRNRGNGQSYGWNASNTDFAFDRNSSRSPDQRYDTLIYMQTGRNWSIAVPNANYRVEIVAGDAKNFDSIFLINGEHSRVVSGTPNTNTRWISGTNIVTVNDGRLTVSNGTGASNNKLCFIHITPQL